MREVPFEIKDYCLFVEEADLPMEAEKRIKRLERGGLMVCFLPTEAFNDAMDAESPVNRFDIKWLNRYGVNHALMPKCDLYERVGNGS